MTNRLKSSSFTDRAGDPRPFGPPLIGALLRAPWEAVQSHMLERLQESGFADFEAAYLPVFGYPGPQGLRPSELAARLRISKQALNYLLGGLEHAGYLERRPHPHDRRSKHIALTARGVSAVEVIRAAVAETELRWSKQLGKQRFGELRALLQELNRAGGSGSDRPQGD
jgi:DNA-binding MarR family transcriptional regulator